MEPTILQVIQLSYSLSDVGDDIAYIRNSQRSPIVRHGQSDTESTGLKHLLRLIDSAGIDLHNALTTQSPRRGISIG